jgi:outer membrane protein assembly factor BamB
MKKIITFFIVFLFVFVSGVNAVHLSDETFQDEFIGTQSSVDNGGLMDSAWPMYCHDVRHTGRSPYGKEGDYFVEKWRFFVGGTQASSPAIDENGTLYLGAGYIGGGEWEFFAVYPNGTLKWRYKAANVFDSSPAIAEDGTIYVGCNSGYLFAFNPDGTRRWKRTVGAGWVTSSPVIDENGIIYVASVDGKNIRAFYPNGTIKWNYKTNGLIFNSPALDKNGTLYIGSQDFHLYAIYKNNGSLKWKFKTGGKVGAPPTIGGDGIIYFGSNDHNLYALYPNGTLKWRFSVGYDALTSSPAFSKEGNIYFGCHAGFIYCLDSDGKEKWCYQTNSEISEPVTIDINGIIYAGDWDGTFYALNPDGTARWKYFTDDYIMVSPVISEDGTIYFSNWDEYLYALELIDIDNEPPLKPNVDGPMEGKQRKEYTFTATTTDPNGDNVSYFFDWDHDNENSDWTDFIPSGESVSVKYIFYLKGTYNIKVRAQDEHGADSKWTTFEVNIPRTRASSYHWLLERFPLLERLMNLILT